MNIFRINTTAYEEEDFYIMTTLTPKQIAEVLTPILEAERENYDDYDKRDGHEEYDNDYLIGVLRQTYPLEVVEHRVDIETLTF